MQGLGTAEQAVHLGMRVLWQTNISDSWNRDAPLEARFENVVYRDPS
jgi:hypothetical protein